MLVGASGIGGLGVRLGLLEQMGFASFGLVHMLTLNLAIVGTVGSPR